MTKDKVFQLNQTAVEKLAEEYGTPLLVLSLDQVKANYECLREYMPRVKVFYAIKANPHPEILRTMIDLGSSCFSWRNSCFKRNGCYWRTFYLCKSRKNWRWL